MAEENSPNTPSGDISNTPKKETVRITLPAKAAVAPMIKRETVRINAPPAAAPKKETTHLPGLGEATSSAPSPAISQPFVPASPPAIKPAPPGGTLPGIRPLSVPGVPMAPRPIAPLKPAGPPAAPAAPAAAAPVAVPAPEAVKPVTMKPAAPKKETARIQIPPDAKPVMPKATIRLQQTQPLSAPVSAVKATPSTLARVNMDEEEDDPLVGILSWVVLVASLAAVALSYLAYSAA